MKCLVMVTRYGFATVSGENEEDILERVETMNESDFDWSNEYTDDAQIIEEREDESVVSDQ